MVDYLITIHLESTRKTRGKVGKYLEFSDIVLNYLLVSLKMDSR